MPIARSLAAQLEKSSWIRRMFEEGARLKNERGEDAVFDFTLGNPETEPPAIVQEALRSVVSDPALRLHGYMPNLGFPDVRAAIARNLTEETGQPFVAEGVCMTVGAAGACNVILKAILDPGDEVMLIAPYFAEYPFYVGNHGGRVVVVESSDDFLPDVGAIAKAWTPKTRAILLNTPNNPTGRIYPAETLTHLQAWLATLSDPPLVISDEPYKCLTYDGRRATPVASILQSCAICYSWSKAQALAGERIGYLALSPNIPNIAGLMNACAFANRTLGFVNAPAIWQRVMARVPNACVDVAAYQQKRDVLCDGLASAGYEVRKPEGGYYVFFPSPIPDDVEFVGRLLREGILAVPGTGFGRPGYVRLSLTVPIVKVVQSLPGFKRAIG